jgi:hypothetical protein
MTFNFPPLPPILPSTNASDHKGSDKPTQDGDLSSVPVRGLRSGAWLTTFHLSNSPLIAFDGTIRVEVHPASAGQYTASGDLYQRPPHESEPRPEAGIPAHPFDQYKYYLSITRILEEGNKVKLEFDRWAYTLPATTGSAGTWANEGSFNAVMARIAPPAGYPGAHDYLSGDVKTTPGIVIGSLTMGWVSDLLRKATIEIDSVAGVQLPMNNGLTGDKYFDWKKVFRSVSWDMTVINSQSTIPEPSGDGWTDAELHAGMLRWRDRSDLGTQWRFHLMCVKAIDSTPRGIMYDAYGTDSNKVPREGAAIATSWIIDPGWGRVTGERFGAVPEAYFRASVHEIGHALSLLHNLRNQHFMDTSDQIAAAGQVTPPSFPDNINWSFAVEDAHRLKHWPDIVVRPGGSPFGSSTNVPTMPASDSEVTLPGIELLVIPTLFEFPLGAPVRLELRLRNSAGNGGSPVQVPSNISLRSGFTQGKVKDHTGVSKTFRSIVVNDGGTYISLNPGGEVAASITLLRGAEGALFASAGLHDVSVEIKWDVPGGFVNIVGTTTVRVTEPKDASHSAAANKLLASPDAHLVLIMGGDHLKDGISAIHAALKDDTLRPHYEFVEAKRVATRFEDRKPDVQAAKELISDSSIVTDSERQKLQSLLD